MKKSRKEYGITLISLVITIIILIILGGVSINIAIGDNGIFNKAKYAKEKQKMTEVQEKIEIAIMDIQSDKISKDEECTIDTIVSEITTKIDNLIISKEGKNAIGIYDNCNFTITSNLELIMEEYNESNLTKLKEGDYIKYNTGVESVGENGIMICRVLYDMSSEYGLQIITDENLEEVSLGAEDWETARNEYNDAIEKLNKVAEKYLNTKYATDARCVGSVPTLKNGIFIDKNSENEEFVELEFSSTIEGANNMKEKDNNYETDQIQMKKLDMLANGEWYWLASRTTDFSSNNSGITNWFNVRSNNEEGELGDGNLASVNSNNVSDGNIRTRKIRPCFCLKLDIEIIEGDGKTKETAYII